MKRFLRLISCLAATALLSSTFGLNTSALIDIKGNSTSYTYTLSSDGKWVRSQDAYLPENIFFIDAPLNSPEDIFVKNKIMYIAESGEGRIVKYDMASGTKSTVGEDILNFPTGVFVDGNENLYVADGGLGKVLVFDKNGAKINEYSRPTEQSFGKNTAFKPQKVAVDKSGILSVVCEGSYDGIVQISNTGAFLGYFGYNVVPVSFTEIIQDKFFTEAQKQKLFNKIPLTFYNLAEDEQGMIYTVTQSSSGNAVKKHNVSGSNIISNAMTDETNFTDISVSADGNIFAVTETGMVFEYDNDGNLLFSFGGYAIKSERNGLITVASGIAADESGALYVLDKERGLVHFYLPTAFTLGLHEAINLYRDGDYLKSCSKLNDLLMLSGNVSVIYEYLAKDKEQLKDYDSAADYYKKAGDRNGYSSAFWELRNKKTGKYLAPFLIALIVVAVLLAILKAFVKKEKPTFAHKGTAGLKDLAYGFRMLKHPFDCCYEIKVGRHGSILSATLFYLLSLAVFVINYLFSGFAFNSRSVENTSLAFTVFLFLVPTALFILCSFLVTEINDGKGSFGKIYIAMSYSLTPLIVLLPVSAILSHILTLSESFIIVCLSVVAYVWTGFLVIVSIKEIHEYEFSQIVLNIVLTLFMMIVVVFAVSILYMFWDKVIEVFSSILREVKYRAFG